MTQPRYILGGQPSGSGTSAYKGSWVAGTYPQGSLVRRGPFLFGANQDTAVDPCDAGNVGSAADWALFSAGGGALQSGNIARFTNAATAQQGAIYRNVTMSTWNQKRIIADMLTGPNGNADGIVVGVHDAAITPSEANARNAPGVYGFYVDIWNSGSGCSVNTILNGVQGNTVSVSVSGQITGNEILETTRFYRYYFDMVESGANWILTLWRDAYDLTTSDGINRPGFLATWTVAKPPFTECRLVVGGVTGGVAGTHASRACYAIDRSGAWDMVAAFPHAPRIDTELWW